MKSFSHWIAITFFVVILFLSNILSRVFACDVATDVKIMGWNPKKSSLLLEVTLSSMDDASSKEKAYEIQTLELSLANAQVIQSAEFKNEHFRQKARDWLDKKMLRGYQPFSGPRLSRHGDEFTEPNGQGILTLKIEDKDEKNNSGWFSLYQKKRGEAAERKVSSKLLQTSLSASETTSPYALFFAGNSLVGLHKGCGNVELWSIPRAILE